QHAPSRPRHLRPNPIPRNHHNRMLSHRQSFAELYAQPTFSARARNSSLVVCRLWFVATAQFRTTNYKPHTTNHKRIQTSGFRGNFTYGSRTSSSPSISRVRITSSRFRDILNLAKTVVIRSVRVEIICGSVSWAERVWAGRGIARRAP